jgi:hypothetical protein
MGMEIVSSPEGTTVNSLGREPLERKANQPAEPRRGGRAIAAPSNRGGFSPPPFQGLTLLAIDGRRFAAVAAHHSPITTHHLPLATHHRVPRPVSAILAMLLLSLPVVVRAGTVETAKGTVVGNIQFAPATVNVGDKQIAWADVLSLTIEPSGGTLPHLNSLRLRSGELWTGMIVKSSATQLDFRGDWLGPRSVDVSLLWILEFTPQPPPLADLKRQRLYRQRGESVPGALLWIENASLGLDSPLGATDIKRQGVLRYVFDNQPPAPPHDLDEVGLTDGSILRGRAQADRDTLQLEHPLLGRVDFPTRAVRFVLRHSNAMIDLGQLRPLSLDMGSSDTWTQGRQTSLTISPLAFAAATASDRLGHTPAAGPIEVMRLEPKLTARYALPKRDGRKLLCRATVVPLEEARGDTLLRMSIGKQSVWQKQVSPADRAMPLEVALPAGEELVIDVDFGTLLRFPCGIRLLDPHLVLVK